MRSIYTLLLMGTLYGCETKPENNAVTTSPEGGSEDSGSATTDTDDPDTDDPDTDDPDTDDPDPEDSGTEDSGTEDSGTGEGMDSGMMEEEPIEYEFEEVDGLAVVEFEDYYLSVADPRGEDYHQWYAFNPDDVPEVTCPTNVACNEASPPDCNEYANCDDDSWDFDEVSGGYVESLPNRRRTDHESNTGFCVRNDPEDTPYLEYRVNFTSADRYYVWVRCQARGPADNGIHVGIDGEWPRNELIDASGMRLQLPNGTRWTQNRRGGRQHTGVSASGDVSRRDANVWIEVDTAGVHTIQFGMREDGVACDKFILASDPDYEPSGHGPDATRPD